MVDARLQGLKASGEKVKQSFRPNTRAPIDLTKRAKEAATSEDSQAEKRQRLELASAAIPAGGIGAAQSNVNAGLNYKTYFF